MSLSDHHRQQQLIKSVKRIKDPLTLYANDILTVPVNLAGVPAISVPCGFSNGLAARLANHRKTFR